MSPYKAVFGHQYPLLPTTLFKNSSVPASDDHLNCHQAIRNDAFQAVKAARFRSTTAAQKRRRKHDPISPGDMLMVHSNMFITNVGCSKKLQPRWCGPFKVVSFDEHTENYTVQMDGRMYRRNTAVFHASAVKRFQQMTTPSSLEGPTLDLHLSSLKER